MANEKRNLIDRDELIDSLGASDMEIFAKEVIEDAPTVDAVEVVHAYWKGDEPGDWHCSHCGECAADGGYEQTNYCPNCGAKMYKNENP